MSHPLAYCTPACSNMREIGSLMTPGPTDHLGYNHSAHMTELFVENLEDRDVSAPCH